MIEISSVNPAKPIIRFSPRNGFKRKAKVLELPLIYGHKCPVCGNVIQAYFETPKAISLWPYEETTILSQGEQNSGEVLKIFPTNAEKIKDTCYNTIVFDGAQRIVLKNHILNFSVYTHRMPNGDGIWEVGERPCLKVGVFSVREDLLIKDLILASRMGMEEIGQYNLPTVKQVIANHNSGDEELMSIPAVGDAPPIVLVNRGCIVTGFYYSLRRMLAPFKNNKVISTQPEEI